MPPTRNIPNVIIEDSNVLFKNFAGREDMYNREGDRNFCVLLEEELAVQMVKDGWNIKTLKAREEGDEPRPYVEVAVGYKGRRPPKVVLITSKGRTDLPEEQVEVLDWIEWAKSDLIVRPYPWGPINGKSGVKAYLKSIFVTQLEDELDRKYADVPEIAAAPAPRELEGGASVNVIQGRVEYDEED